MIIFLRDVNIYAFFAFSVTFCCRMLPIIYHYRFRRMSALDSQASTAFTEPEDGFADDDLLAPDDISGQ
ncbi:unnamed protein product [Strongylus vulgaris]|uniref:Uncharacterized protein n=1 Tax=Strongylus vulgaris TaxID=40348 RepID=A0A3P7ITP0_STRVU|nr:unnamed protein product [Strongylus vulgaris]